MLERINGAFNSPPQEIKTFDELKNIRKMDVYKDGFFVGKGLVGTLPYGSGSIIQMIDDGREHNADAHRPFGYGGVCISRLEWPVVWPIEVRFTD
ncbi:hypothetical protein LCGC14_0782470 [marine sediment metagenome]|uniref:Uncharacterized protein n=1 Tax=marine sediment metagenome TaxID=412755 RepID=A0A0F9SEY2_9ZZZZ